MNTQRKHPIFAWMLIMALCAGLLGGCLPKRDEARTTTAAPFEEQLPGDYEHFEEQQIKMQKEFDRQMAKLFKEEISCSRIDQHYLLKNPAALGIEKTQELYAPISMEAMAENFQDRQTLEAQLNQFDAALLTEDQKVALRILKSYLKTEKLADGLELYAQPLAVTIGTQAQLPILLSEYVFYTKEDVDDYLELLAGIDEYYQQIMDFEKQKAEAGLMMSDTTIDHVIESCESYLLVPGDNFMIDTFNARLAEVPNLTEEEIAAYKEKHEALLESDFVPAYQLLIDGLTALKGTGTNEKGLCGFPQGKEYYRYLVYSATGTSYESIESLLKDMEKTLEEYLLQTSELLKANPQLLDELESYQFRQTTPEGIMEELKTLMKDRFPPLPQCNYTFKDVPKALELSLSPAFYLVSPIDDIQNNVIYINHNPRFSSNDLYTVIAHEGYPGHLYQSVYFHTNCSSNIRQIVSFPGYTEGWATYVEQLAYTLDNGLSQELGQLLSANYMASLGLSAYLDVCINYMGWDVEQVKEYLSNYYSQPEEVAESIFHTMIETPANYLSYYVGCMEFMNMRKAAEKQLKDQFDEKEFHTFLMDLGTAPFDVIQPYLTSWLMEQKF